MKNFVVSLVLTQVIASSAFALVGIYDNRYVGYVRGDAFVGLNHEAKSISLNVDLENFTTDQIADIYSCEFRALDGENVGFTVDVNDKNKITYAGCAVAPAEEYRKAWDLMLTILGL
jgi:hypothetical protein